ncbi:hypothetical protein [Chitinophaga rhizosphaerae]|uniref:hypothetical protein n=1 Tax=Chitinophaga rhizosphaerae TaxID=1864947 RepID=UPI000F80A51C|nr:hypothetical protein [Chitinophaga rhizosphaerae]
MDELVKEIDSWIDQIPSVASDVEYWLIRTQSGKYYDSFKEHNFIAIEHEEISLGLLHTLKTIHGEDTTSFFEALKAKVIELYPDDRSPGLTTNQIIRFVYKLKTNDVIIIPSENSKYLTFGVVTSNTIPELSEHQLNITGCPYRKRKKVKWNKTIKRSDLDPYLFKMLQSHQAISNINNYAELIQRNLRDFYLLNDEINLVLDVNPMMKSKQQIYLDLVIVF